MNKTLKKNQGIPEKKRSIKVKSDTISVDESEPKKRGPKAKVKAVKPVLVDVAHLMEVYDLIDPQLSKLIRGNRVKVGKLWAQMKKKMFYIYLTETSSKKLYEAIADNDGKGYEGMLVYLADHFDGSDYPAGYQEEFIPEDVADDGEGEYVGCVEIEND